MIHDLVEELFLIVDRILPKGMESGGMPDKCVSRYVERRERVKQLPKSSTMDLTFDDDVIGVVPQLTTGSIHELHAIHQTKVRLRRSTNTGAGSCNPRSGS